MNINTRRAAFFAFMLMLVFFCTTIYLLVKYTDEEHNKSMLVKANKKCGLKSSTVNGVTIITETDDGCRGTDTDKAALAFNIGSLFTYLITARWLWFFVSNINLYDTNRNDSCNEFLFVTITYISWTYSILSSIVAWGSNCDGGRCIPITPLQWTPFIFIMTIFGILALLLLIFIGYIFSCESLCSESISELFKCSCCCFSAKKKWIDAKCRICDIEMQEGVVNILNCQHTFHNKCISDKQLKCPQCI